jgi:hypothetical protein
MHRLRYAVGAAFLSGILAGCGGEDQPNAPAKPEEVNVDFAKKTADMMKAANTGMDPKKVKSAAGKPATPPPPSSK